jgi:subtilisin-like proprotein convertase family protein
VSPPMKTLIILTAAVAPHAASAATAFGETWVVNSTIPDNDPVGFSDTRDIVTDVPIITEVTVDLVFSGGWNGDLFAYLVHDSGYSVLLNRVGRNAAELDGSGSSGISLTLSDAASADVHLSAPTTGSFTGTYQPDGRAIDPSLVTDSDSRTALLSSFVGLPGDGSWTLFVADVGPGGQSSLESWSLNIIGIPEPSTAFLCLVGLAPLLRRKR